MRISCFQTRCFGNEWLIDMAPRKDCCSDPSVCELGGSRSIVLTSLCYRRSSGVGRSSWARAWLVELELDPGLPGGSFHALVPVDNGSVVPSAGQRIWPGLGDGGRVYSFFSSKYHPLELSREQFFKEEASCNQTGRGMAWRSDRPFLLLILPIVSVPVSRS